MSTLKPRTATIPIYQGDDAERLAELRMAVAVAERQAEIKRMEWENAQRTTVRRVGDSVGTTAAEVEQANDAVQEARDEYDAFVDEAAERAVEVVVRTIGRRRFRDLVAAHPPRTVKNDKGDDIPHDDDFAFGVNVETFAPALLKYVDPESVDDDGKPLRTIVGPESVAKSSRTLEDFLDDEVTDGDYEKIFTIAYWNNRAAGSDPKELRYSPSTSATSE